MKRIVKIHGTSYALLKGRPTGRERKRSKWTREGKWGKIVGKRDKKSFINKCCLTEPRA